MGPPHLSANHFAWALGSMCALHNRPFSPELLLKQFPPRYDEVSLIAAGRELGFKVKAQTLKLQEIAGLPLPVLVQLKLKTPSAAPNLALVVNSDIPTDQDIEGLAVPVSEPSSLSDFLPRQRSTSVTILYR